MCCKYPFLFYQSFSFVVIKRIHLKKLYFSKIISLGINQISMEQCFKELDIGNIKSAYVYCVRICGLVGVIY